MHQELFIALISGLAAMLGWGLADFFAKKTIDEIGDVVSLAWGHAFGTLFFALLALYQIIAYGHYLTLPKDVLSWGFVLFFGVLQAGVYLLVYQGFGKGQVAVLNPVFASYSGLVALLSVVFFKEVLAVHSVPALVAIFLGIFLLSLDIKALFSKKIKLSAGLKEVGLASLLASVWTVFWDKVVGGHDWISYAFLMYLFMTIAVFIFARVRHITIAVVPRNMWKFLVLIGVCETIAYLGISLGFSVTSYTSVVALLSGAFSLPTIVLARIFLKEKITMVQALGGIIIITGIIVLSLQ